MNQQEITITSRQQWREWLSKHHDHSGSILVISYKKTSNKPYVSYEELVLEGLCFGWVDSKNKSIDEERTSYLFSQRKARSYWSKSNKDRVEMLISQGLMTEAGQKYIDAARENGDWEFLDDIEKLIVPEDLQAAFDDQPHAGKMFDELTPARKREILLSLKTAKREETRRNRLKKHLSLLLDES